MGKKRLLKRDKLCKDSWRKTIRRVKLELKPGSIDYAEWISRHEKPDLKEQRKEAQGFAYRPLISILMPVYNVEIKWLENALIRYWIKRMITGNYVSVMMLLLIQLSESVWNPIKQRMIESKLFSDKKMDISVWQLILRWKWQKENLALLDNDDELPPFALYEVAKC